MRNPFKKKTEVKEAQYETVLQQLVAAAGGSATNVTPENCLKSPTMQAIHTAVTNRISSTPVHIYRTSEKNGKEIKEKLPNHPIARLLRQPNPYQTSVNYWADLASCLVRYNRFIAVKAQGSTGPIFQLNPVSPGEVTIKQDENTFAVTFTRGDQDWPMRRVHYIRGPARDFVNGDSIVDNIKLSIAIEIAMEEFSGTFFSNGAVPLLFFKYMQGVKGFKDPEDEKKFISDFQAAFSGNKRHTAFLLPAGIETPDGPQIDNEKSQNLEFRRYYQTVIAGAYNVPPHMVGNLENGHYNNVEQQDKDFTISVMMPYFRMIEAAMERDLLSDADRKDGVVIRFNMDATLRASFMERQQGLEVQRRNGVINPNEWRELEGKNPRDDGDDYGYSANMIIEGQEPASREMPPEEETDADTETDDE